MLTIIVLIMREKIRRTWMASLRVQAGSIRRSAEDLCHSGMVGQGGEGRDPKHRVLMRGCINCFDSHEMRWASCCGVSFGGCNAWLSVIDLMRGLCLFSSKKTFPDKMGGDC